MFYSTDGTQIVCYEYDAWGNCITKYLQDDETYAKVESGYSVTDTSNINRFIAFKNPFRYRSYYYDEETKLYYLNSRYYDPQICRFINADDISILSEGKEFFNGLNLYAYCGNNPINNTDESGNAWWHWLIAALVVIAAAVAVVVTAGGATAGILAVASVLAGGSATTIGATIAAGVFIGSVTSFTAFSIIAGFESINILSNGGSIYSALDNFSSYGESAMWSTLGSGLFGGIISYLSHVDYGTQTPKSLRPLGKYYNTNGKTLTHYGLNGDMSWSKHFTDHNRPWSHAAPHWHLELPHSEPGFNTRWQLVKALIKRLFGK